MNKTWKVGVAALALAVCGWTSSVQAQENLAQGKEVVVSTVENDGTLAKFATDGDMGTRWSSQFDDNQWLYVDLGKAQKFSKVSLFWETAFGQEYTIQVSDDAKTWKDVLKVTDGKTGEDTRTFDTVTARYVKILGSKRGTEYGYSLWEIKVAAQ